ncbi:MAG: hypothetical protein HKM93_16460 [Desulfobacteraceae bacterium]|nr:hypothetical protein [Desulfobacteraceae bacterium]
MTESLEIPGALKNTFHRLLRRIPIELRNDQQLLRIILAYLKMGGEKLARQGINVAIERYRDDVKIMKKRLREEALIKAALAENEDTSDDKDNDDDDENDDDENDDDDDDNDYDNDNDNDNDNSKYF